MAALLGVRRSIPLLSIRGATQLRVADNSGSGIAEAQQSDILHMLNTSRASLPQSERDAIAARWQEWAHIDTQFVSVAVALDTSKLSPAQRLYLPLLMETAWKLPCVLEDGTQLSKDEFVSGLQADTVRYSCSSGAVRGGSSQLLTFFVQV